ncbi:histidine kinase [Stieleria sp. JC731]|nr:ATP-binding protein [Stieleria sp. JC731]MCC9601710.1 histidine kinase [Stieleria sp. JC731]
MTSSELIDLERSQIGHDIHDLLLPLIFGASATLQSLKWTSDEEGIKLDSSAAEKIDLVRQWLQEALSLGRNLLTEIYPPELESLPWLMAAQDAVTKICGDECEAEWVIDPSTPLGHPKLHRDLATTAYRVLVESVRNATRHGKATAVSIRCDSNSLSIEDNGTGFNPNEVPSGHFGIRAMKGRAALVGKTLSVESKPGGPTLVNLSLH